jgi:hypothetical protein
MDAVPALGAGEKNLDPDQIVSNIMDIAATGVS